MGSLCILPHVKLSDVRTQSPDVPPAAEKYALRLDDGLWVALSSQQRVLLTNITRADRHKVAIRGDGHPWAAFNLTFDPSVPDLCLYQDDFYLTWRLDDPKHSFASCRCTGVTPTTWKAPARR